MRDCAFVVFATREVNLALLQFNKFVPTLSATKGVHNVPFRCPKGTCGSIVQAKRRPSSRRCKGVGGIRSQVPRCRQKHGAPESPPPRKRSRSRSKRRWVKCASQGPTSTPRQRVTL